MSEQANTALIQKVYAAFNSGDIQTILSNVAPDAGWVDYGPPGVPYFGDFTGRIADFFKAIGGSTMGGSVTIDRYIASNDMVVTEGRYRATVPATGANIDVPVAHVFTVRDGKIVSWRGHTDTAAVLAAHTGKAASA
jgi:ketosteroid isomerase-like protein